MKLYIGGAYQGKTAYVQQQTGIMAKKCSYDTAFTTKAINCYHLLIRDLLNNGYTSSSIGKRNKGRKNNYDYNMSIKSLIGRINENLSFEATNIYRIELVNDKYILRRV